MYLNCLSYHQESWVKHNKKIQILFGSFIISFFVLHVLSHWMDQRQVKHSQEEISILHAEVENNFRLLVENHYSVLLIASAIAVTEQDLLGAYTKIADEILKSFDGVMQLNFVESSGDITIIAPKEKNRLAIGKQLINYKEMMVSLERGEKVYLSPPFELYPGILGVSLYFPVFKGRKFLGWLALVQGLDRFIEKFLVTNFFGSYHLTIKDIETGANYYASAEVPGEKSVFSTKVNIMGREINFISWRKTDELISSVSWPLLLIMSFFLSVLVAATYSAYEQKGRARKELENIEILLRGTFNSTSRNLNSIQEQLELIKLGSGFVPLNKISNHLANLSYLIDQLRVLVKISESQQLKRTAILPMLIDLTKVLEEKLNLKDLHLSFNTQYFMGVEVETRHWSIYYSALENVLNYFITISERGEEITITLEDSPIPSVCVMNSSQLHKEDVLTRIDLPENLMKATIAIESQHGKLFLANRPDHGAVVVISLPDLLRLAAFP